MKRVVIMVAVALVLIGGGVLVWYAVSVSHRSQTPSTTTTAVRFVSSLITADGTVTAQNQAKLNFQIGGKLVYLPLKEGDKVSMGQTIASLDTYTVNEQLKAALNTYRTVRNTFDQNKENISNNVAVAQQSVPYNYYAAAGISGGDKNNAVNNAIARIADNNQASLDNSVINVELANYGFQLSRLTSPLNGIITHEDVTVAGMNVTPLTSFTVADPSTMVFRANVPTENIYYITEGSTVTLAIDGLPTKIQGTVIKIFPSKVTLSNGQSVYQVDIQSDQLLKMAKLDQTGTALIKTNEEHVALVPAWVVLGGKYIWVDNEGKPVLKTVTTGKVHGQAIEITSGLTAQDHIIIDPASIHALHYSVL